MVVVLYCSVCECVKGKLCLSFAAFMVPEASKMRKREPTPCTELVPERHLAISRWHY